LTYNSKDQCCFEAGYALPPLLAAARPIFKLHGKENALRSHINDDPGTHNFEQDNRQALYRMIGDFFYPGDKTFNAKEIDSTKEIKTAEELQVELPKDNASFNSLARSLAKSLPHGKADSKTLGEIVKATPWSAKATKVATSETKGTKSTQWKIRLGEKWTVPVVELSRGKPEKTALLLNDAGRKADPVNAEALLQAGYRVLAVDLFYFGEARIASHDWLYALLVSALGDRPLGIQASQLSALARWSVEQYKSGPIHVVAIGPRLSLVTLVATALEPKAIGSVELDGCRKSLAEVITENRTVDQMPEMFCFGFLERFDIPQLVQLVKPREVRFRAK
jgi:hypothetical protein